ncbi:MAG: helix-hairpin-helix domain-containing protein [Chloroflexota bacterium]
MRNILWLVLAGFILGFATSTIWEWYYYRSKRMLNGSPINGNRNNEDQLARNPTTTVDDKGNGEREWGSPVAQASTGQVPLPSRVIDDPILPTVPAAAYRSEAALLDDEQQNGIPDGSPPQEDWQTRSKVEETLARLREPSPSPTSWSAQNEHSIGIEQSLDSQQVVQPEEVEPVREKNRMEGGSDERISFRKGPVQSRYRQQLQSKFEQAADSASSTIDRVEAAITPDRTERIDEAEAISVAIPITNYAEETRIETKSDHSEGTREEAAESIPIQNALEQTLEEAFESMPIPNTLEGTVTESDEAVLPQNHIEEPDSQLETLDKGSMHLTASPSSQLTPNEDPENREESPQVADEISEEYPDNLDQIKGIGRVSQKKLYDHGIYTWHQLSQTDKERLREITNASGKVNVEEWKEQAHMLAEATGRLGVSYNGLPPDDLTLIPGITRSIEKQLYRSGIVTYQALASCSKEQLATLMPKAPNLTASTFSQWIAHAKEAQT